MERSIAIPAPRIEAGRLVFFERYLYDHAHDDEKDFVALRNVGQRPTGLLVTLLVNWVVKPFSVAFLAWLFFRHLFAGFVSPAEADQYIAGRIILAAAPCTQWYSFGVI